MDSEILIEARGLTRRYGPAVAVSQLNLTLRKGEILGMLGPNGAGKSTTMKMLTGNLAPSEGEARIKGISLHDAPTAAKQHLGYLPEQPPVYPELTVDEYLRYCAGLHGIAGNERGDAVTRAKKSCGLADVGNRLIVNLSKGYQQRVGLAQAIIHRPPVIVLDEPTVGLGPDPDSRNPRTDRRAGQIAQRDSVQPHPAGNPGSVFTRDDHQQRPRGLRRTDHRYA